MIHLFGELSGIRDRCKLEKPRVSKWLGTQARIVVSKSLGQNFFGLMPDCEGNKDPASVTTLRNRGIVSATPGSHFERQVRKRRRGRYADSHLHFGGVRTARPDGKLLPNCGAFVTNSVRTEIE